MVPIPSSRHCSASRAALMLLLVVAPVDAHAGDAGIDPGRRLADPLTSLDHLALHLDWDTQIGGAVRGIPISYSVDGKQYIAIAAGFTLFVFAL